MFKSYKDVTLDTLKNKTLLGTDINGKIIESTYTAPAETDPLSLHLDGETTDVTNGTFNLTTTGTIQAEHLYSTDDIDADHDLYVGNQMFIGGVTATSSVLGNLGTNLVSRWKLDENAANSTVTDDIGVNSGKLYSDAAEANTSTVSTTGLLTNAFDLEKDNKQHVLVASPTIDISTAFTISCWVYLESKASWTSYVAQKNSGGTDECFILGENTGIYLGVWKGGVQNYFQASESIPTGQWVSIVGTYDGTTLRGYLNNVLCSNTKAVAAPFDTSTGALMIGRRHASGSGTGYNIDGKIDEVRIYNRCLNADELTALYNSGVGTTSTGEVVVGSTHQVVATSASYTSSHSLDSLADLAIEGELEVDGDTFHDDDVHIIDSKYIKLGTADAATIGYNATNLLINPKAVGSGYLNIQGQTLVDDKIMFTQTDGNEYIDSLNDGYMDYGATTAHRFNTPVRSSTASYRRYYHLPMDGFNPGQSGATWTAPSANTVGGWRLDAETEVLYFDTDVHADWDGASDLEVEIYFAVNIDNTGGGAGDTVDLKLVCYYNTTGDVATKTQTQEVATVVGASAQYKVFKSVHTINFDETDNVVEAGDIMGFALNLETDTSEVDDIVILHGSFNYNTTHIGLESTDT